MGDDNTAFTLSDLLLDLENFSNVEYYIETSGGRTHITGLEQEFKRSLKWARKNKEVKEVNWDCEIKVSNRALWQTVGSFGRMPVSLNFDFATVNGHQVCFYYSESVVVHWGLINTWCRKRVPNFIDNNARDIHRLLKFVKK